MTDRLPDNDPDSILAQKIEELREQGRSLSEMDDPFIETLLNYKKEKRQKEITSDDKQAVWEQIEASTKPDNKATIFRLTSSSLVRWAAVAIVVIAAVFSFLYLRGGHKPKLLASSHQTIKSVTLKDGSTITLRPHSKLFRVKRQDSKAVYKLKGEALFDIAHNPNRKFTVKTKSGKVTVLGTRFILSSWGKQMRVYLQRGKVKVEASQQADSVIIQPGEAAIVNNSKSINVIEMAQADEFTDWLNQRLVFDNKPASLVVSELEQQFDISIFLPEKIAKKRISGQLSLKKLQPVLENLGLVLNGTFKKTGPHRYTFKPTSR